MTKSEIFTQYNKARAAARRGKLDAKRVNRALGVAQSKTPRPYITTARTCNCPDHIKNPAIACKHMIAKMIEVRASQSRTV